MSMAMADRTREAKTAKGVPLGESVKLSGLTYPMVRPMSLVTSRRLISHDFQTSTYNAGSTATCFINSGDDYVWGRGSNLRFDVVLGITPADPGDVKNDTKASFGEYGSAINLIKNIEIYHSSGTQVDRVANVNSFHAGYRLLTKDSLWATKEGTVMGAGMADDYMNQTTYAGHTYSFSIPLSELHPFWNTEKLTPSMLHSGLKVVLQLSGIAEAIKKGASTDNITSISLKNMSIECDSLTLTDSAQLYLQEESAKNGLVYPFLSYENITVTGETNITTNVFRAVSQATGAFAYGRLAADITNEAKDSFAPTAITSAATATASNTTNPFSVQWKIAGMYFPVKQITNYTDLYAWNRNQFGNHSMAFDAKYASIANSGVQAVRLERDHLLKHQGIPVSGSRALTYQSKWGANDDKTLNVFMIFVKLARVFLYDKLIISE